MCGDDRLRTSSPIAPIFNVEVVRASLTEIRLRINHPGQTLLTGNYGMTMIRFVFALCIAALFATAVSAETVRFATFNVFWLYDDDPPHQKWAGMREGHTWEQTLAKVADAVAAINADVIALQEVEDRSAIQSLNAALADRGKSYPFFWVSAGTDPFTGQDVAVLSRYPNLIEPIRSYPTVRGEFHTDKGYPRLAALQKLMRVDVEIAGEPVTVYALHLKSKRGDPITSDGERFAQARMIRRLVRAVLEKDHKPQVVVMGDFNDGPGSDALREIQGLNDASWDLRDAAESEKMQGERWTYDFDGRKEQLDHVLLSRSLFDKVTSATVIRFSDDVSDHDAFVVDVQIGD